MKTINKQRVQRHRNVHNNEVKTFEIITNKKQINSDSSACKNESYRSYSRGGDNRLPPLIETPRGRLCTDLFGTSTLLHRFLFATNQVDFLDFFFLSIRRDNTNRREEKKERTNTQQYYSFDCIHIFIQQKKNKMLKKKFLCCQSAFSRYSYLPLEPTVSLTTTQPSTNVVSTTGVSNSQEGIIPIASLFSSMDLAQPATTVRCRSSTPGNATRRTKSFHQNELDSEQISS